MKMSDSDTSGEGQVDSNSSDIKMIKSHGKRYRLKRKGKLLQIHTTESELKYRKNFEKFNAVNDLYELINCTMCNASFKQNILEGKEIHSHPLLKVLMCKSCCKFYGDGYFSLDEDGEDKYCRWCGDGGKLFLCSKCICGFCPGCIKKHFGTRKLSEIKKDDDWVCYLCNPEPLWKLRTICYLAQQQSESNKIQNTKNLSEPTRTTSSRKDSDQKLEFIGSRQNDKESCKDDSTAEVESERNVRWTRRSSRWKDSSQPRGDVSSCNSKKWSANSEPEYKKRKIERDYEKDGRGVVNGNERKKEAKYKNSSCTSSTESDEDLEETRLTEPDEEETQYVGKNKYAEKLKEILKIAEITSQLCFKLCRKEFKKLDKKNYIISNEKLITNCENLKSMIILMSSSLSTVHSMIISLQKKFGGKGVNGVFEGGEATSLLKTIGHVLMDNRVKTSHLVSIVNDILNRYPYIELRTALNRDLICENHTKSDNINSQYSVCEADPVISQAGSGVLTTNEKTVKGGLKNDFNSYRKSESDSPNKVSSEGASSTNKLRHDGDISTDLIESDNRSTGRNNGNTSILEGVYSASESGEQLHKDGGSDFDMELKKFYETSLKLKEQILKDSSDDTSSSTSEMSDSSTTVSVRERRVKERYSRGKGRPQKDKLSKEEKEINRLTNLRSLERRRISEHSDTSIGSEKPSQNQQRTSLKNKKVDEKESSTDNISVGSKYDNHSNDGLELPGPPSEMDFIKNCSALLKEYILESTSSELEAPETVEEETEKPKKKKNYQSNCQSTKKYRSRLKFDCFSTSTSGDSRDEEETRRKRIMKKSKTDSSPDRDSSSDNFRPSKRKKRKSKIILSEDSDSSCITLETPSKPSVESPGKGRRTIRKILKKGRLQVETRQAIKLENERKKRIAERNECYKKFFPDMPNSNRLVLDFNRETGEVLLEVPKAIVKNLKPHQKEGVKFMWDNCFESLSSLEQNNGSGCILAHCMGLGKTLQVIALIATLMSNNLGVDTVLILAPFNVVNNWVHEFEKWLKDVDVSVDVYNVIKCRNGYQRACEIREWYREGGVLVLSYDMMRILSKCPKNLGDKPRRAEPLNEYLLDPGPDLVICDEGHVMKNEDTSLSKTISLIQTSRRIILTGTPFQNNLLEYHSMVQFIKPNILGTRREFMNRFGNPIRNGQFEDSTAADVKLMRARAHVLHKLLDGCIQRFNYSVLTPFLPEKHEYVISIRLTETQAKLYTYYVEKCKEITMREEGTKLFSDFHWLQKIWTHPELIRSHVEESEDMNDSQNIGQESSDESVVCIEGDSSEKAYWKTVIKPEECKDYCSSGKLLILFDILKRCSRIGDKVLLFSQSLKNLDLIEYFLRQVHLVNTSEKDNSNRTEVLPEHMDKWVLGHDYFRIDGSTSSDARSKWCKWFNKKENRRARLFLISTKAGGLGINLIGANRVVIFDASWNPSHDVQSIFRIYRFGQLKPCYIYRFVAEATMEEKIYERQVTKLSLEKRVLDEHQIERHYTMGNLQELYKYDPMPKEKWPVPIVPKDWILAEILNLRRDVIVSYHEHDSLLENIEEEKLTEEERKAAWEDFEKEKFMIENQLQRTFGMGRDGQSMEDITREVLRITGMYKASGSEVPFFTPSQTHNFGNNLPFKIVNVQSLDKNYSGASTSQNTNL